MATSMRTHERALLLLTLFDTPLSLFLCVFDKLRLNHLLTHRLWKTPTNINMLTCWLHYGPTMFCLFVCVGEQGKQERKNNREWIISLPASMHSVYYRTNKTNSSLSLSQKEKDRDAIKERHLNEAQGRRHGIETWQHNCSLPRLSLFLPLLSLFIFKDTKRSSILSPPVGSVRRKQKHWHQNETRNGPPSAQNIALLALLSFLSIG